MAELIVIVCCIVATAMIIIARAVRRLQRQVALNYYFLLKLEKELLGLRTVSSPSGGGNGGKPTH